jgi:hypothetical protein
MDDFSGKLCKRLFVRPAHFSFDLISVAGRKLLSAEAGDYIE